MDIIDFSLNYAGRYAGYIQVLYERSLDTLTESELYELGCACWNITEALGFILYRWDRDTESPEVELPLILKSGYDYIIGVALDTENHQFFVRTDRFKSTIINGYGGASKVKVRSILTEDLENFLEKEEWEINETLDIFGFPMHGKVEEVYLIAQFSTTSLSLEDIKETNKIIANQLHGRQLEDFQYLAEDIEEVG